VSIRQLDAEHCVRQSLEHLTLELQSLAGAPVGFGKARETSHPGIYKVAVRYREEHLAKACMQSAFEMLMAAVHDKPFDIEGTLTRLRDLADDVCYGPSTGSIVNAAEARDIPVRRMGTASLAVLGQGARQHRIWTAETDRTTALGESVSCDKDLTRQFLRAAGVPVPEGRTVTNVVDAWEAAQQIGLPVAVKPLDGNHGRGVCLDLKSKAEVEEAFKIAAAQGTAVIVERFAPGNEHRLLVVGDRVVAAARGETAYVTGDGKSNIRELIALQLNSDRRRGVGDAFPLNPVELDEVALLDLEHQGLKPESIPEEGRKVLIQRNGNVAHDVTDKVHPSVAAHAVLATRVVGLDVAGLDLVVSDISKPLEEQHGMFVEVNAGPGLHPHLLPASGSPRPVGEAIVDSLFKPGEDGRIPTVCVTGTNGKTTVARLIAHLLADKGRVVGTACSDGLFVGDRKIRSGDCATFVPARDLLLNPIVEAAVFEAGAESILREGLGFDRCQVAVVTNIGEADHLGCCYIEDPEQMYQVKRCPVDVVTKTGAAVLKADEPLVAEMASLSAGSVVFFALDPSCKVLAEHRAQGKRVAFSRDGHLLLAEGATEIDLGEVSAIPLCRSGAPFQCENVLAAAAAAWALGVSADDLRARLASFGEIAARFEQLSSSGPKVILDSCRNAGAISALGAALERLGTGRRTIVFAPGRERRDCDLALQGERLANVFDRVILSEGTEGGRAAALRQGLAKGSRGPQVLEIPGFQPAVRQALEGIGSDEIVVIQAPEYPSAQAVESREVISQLLALRGAA
jgi:cyanophycin synthetase